MSDNKTTPGTKVFSVHGLDKAVNNTFRITMATYLNDETGKPNVNQIETVFSFTTTDENYFNSFKNIGDKYTFVKQ